MKKKKCYIIIQYSYNNTKIEYLETVSLRDGTNCSCPEQSTYSLRELKSFEGHKTNFV